MGRPWTRASCTDRAPRALQPAAQILPKVLHCDQMWQNPSYRAVVLPVGSQATPSHPLWIWQRGPACPALHVVTRPCGTCLQTEGYPDMERSRCVVLPTNGYLWHPLLQPSLTCGILANNAPQVPPGEQAASLSPSSPASGGDVHCEAGLSSRG